MEIKRSKLVDKNVYVKWYNIAKEEINDKTLIPDRTKDEIFNLVSRENWLIFCPDGVSKEEAVQIPQPNIFFDILSKEGNLTGFGRIGLCFNNVGAYEKFRTIMRGINKEIKDNITKELLQLEHSWDITLARKIKKYNYAQTPVYEEEARWNSKSINEKVIDEIIQKANRIREDGISHKEQARIEKRNPKKFYVETPNINLIEKEFPLNEEFKDRIAEAFKLLILCINVKSDVEANKIIRGKVKKIKELYTELGMLSIEIPKKEALIGVIKQITKESVDSDKERKKEIEEEIERLEEEIEE